MDIQGEKILAVPRAEVWRALNDPAVLQRCLPGCDTFEPEGDNRYRVAMQAAVGPVRARFAGKLRLLDVVPPSSYALAFEGSGGVAGFGKGTAQVALDEVAEGTRLRYVSQAQVGGRLAQVGARLIDGVTQRMADDFFARFVRELGTQEGGVRQAQTPLPKAADATPGAVVVTPTEMPAPALPHPSQPLPSSQAQPSQQSNHIAVIAAAVSATAAAVAVLAALFVVQFAR
jgi:carbon monoxide dehydrogenase subunit G